MNPHHGVLTEPISGARWPGSKFRNPQGPLELNPISAQTFCRLFYQTGSPLRAHPAPRFLSDWSAGLQHKHTPGPVYLSVITASRRFTSELSRVDLIYMCTGSPGSSGGTPRAALDPLLALFCCFQALQKLELFIWQDESTNYLKLLYAVPPLQFFF